MSVFALFSDIFARQDNRLARVDPRTKLAVAAVALVCLVLSGGAVFPVGLFALCTTMTLAVGVPLRQVMVRLAAPLGMAGAAVALRWLLQAGPLGSGLLIVGRVLGGVSVMLLLSAVTPAHQLFRALRVWGMPRGWVEVALLMYRYTFVFLDVVADLTAAQKVRMGYAGVRLAWRSAGVAAGTVILRSVDQAVHAHEAMLVRGYRGEMPFGPLRPLARRDWVMAAAAALLLIGAFWVLEWRLG